MLLTLKLPVAVSSLVALTALTALAAARPFKDSPITTIVVPYQPNATGYPYQLLKALAQTQRVIVPHVKNFMPNFVLSEQNAAPLSSSSKGTPLRIAAGAYPVYYMPGNANGRFGGKISVLK